MSDRIDLLDRGTFIQNVIKVVNQLSENKRGCCFAIEGGWGVGKTFVIEEVEEILKETQSEETNIDKYFVFHYNCWQHDYYEEPAVAIISAMISSLQKDDIIASENIDNTIKAGYELAVDKLKEIAGTFIENKIGVNLISLADDVKEKKEEAEKAVFEFDELFNFSQTIEKARTSLQDIAKERTIVLVVDELDRCIPRYAIKVLERLHHIFYGLDNVVVIMAIDRKQLEHSVEEMFGTKNDDDSMDIEKYLKKFIDFSMMLDNGEINQTLSEKYSFYFDKFTANCGDDTEELNELLIMLFKEIDIRRQEKLIEKANLIHSLICNDVRDISVLAFEVMFGALKIQKFDDMHYIAIINDAHYPTLEKVIGKYMMEMLKEINKKACTPMTISDGRIGKRIYGNLYGKLCWYFAKIFNTNEGLHIYAEEIRENAQKELEIIQRYCEYSEIIK